MPATTSPRRCSMKAWVAGRKRAHGAQHRHRLGHDVVGIAALDLGDRDHGVVERVDLPGDDAAGRLDDQRGGDDRVLAEMRHRRVAADAGELDRELIGRRHGRAVAHGEAADRQLRPVVHADRFPGPENARTALPRPCAGRRHALPRPAGTPGRPCRRNGGSRPDSERHRAAWWCGRHGRRHASCRAWSRHAAGRCARRSAARPCRPAGRCCRCRPPGGSPPRRRSRRSRYAPRRHRIRFSRSATKADGPDLLEAQLRMRVQVPPPSGQLVLPLGDPIDHGHALVPSLTLPPRAQGGCR